MPQFLRTSIKFRIVLLSICHIESVACIVHGPLTIFSKIHNEGLITDIVLPHYTAQTCVKDKEMISKKSGFDLLNKSMPKMLLKWKSNTEIFSAKKKQTFFSYRIFNQNKNDNLCLITFKHTASTKRQNYFFLLSLHLLKWFAAVFLEQRRSEGFL